MSSFFRQVKDLFLFLVMLLILIFGWVYRDWIEKSIPGLVFQVLFVVCCLALIGYIVSAVFFSPVPKAARRTNIRWVRSSHRQR
jgi:hypothetical protein